MQNLLHELITLLKSDERLVSQDGKLIKNKVIELALQNDAGLLKYLLKNQTIKKHFFTEVENIFVFDKLKFMRFVANKQFLPDSYTAYKNKVGLIKTGEYLDNYLTKSNDVVLAFPYKDSILQGGQSKDEDKRNENFWNETLAHDQIDRLLSPKVLTNWRKYDQNGKQKVNNFIGNENLIIKGNNLLALHSLKKRYAQKVKLIYIDPPYNTGNDSFMYNDNFNHSTWLTFMKNRLQVAKDLLKNDGFIFIQIDDFEDSYLKALCDEVFGKENFRNKITWKRRGGSANPSNRLNNVVDYILFYSKNINTEFKHIYTLDDENTQNYIKERFTNTFDDGRKYMLAPIERNAKLGLRENLRYEYKGYIPKYGWMLSKEKLIEFDKKNKLHWNTLNKPNR